MGNNLDAFPELAGREGDDLLRGLAGKARETVEPGPDGVTAVEYIHRAHVFDPEDQMTAKLASLVDCRREPSPIA
jgi:hypothetical protein